MSNTPVSLTVISHPHAVMLSIGGIDGEQLLVGLTSAAIVDDLIERLLTARTITFGLNMPAALTLGFPLGGAPGGAPPGGGPGGAPGGAP